jgi:hypothetical protein
MMDCLPSKVYATLGWHNLSLVDKPSYLTLTRLIIVYYPPRWSHFFFSISSDFTCECKINIDLPYLFVSLYKTILLLEFRKPFVLLKVTFHCCYTSCIFVYLVVICMKIYYIGKTTRGNMRNRKRKGFLGLYLYTKSWIHSLTNSKLTLMFLNHFFVDHLHCCINFLLFLQNVRGWIEDVRFYVWM